MRSAFLLAGLVLAGTVAMGAGTSARAQHATEELPHFPWTFNGPFGTYDRAQLQRGFQVYSEVCSNCHSMKELYYRNLKEIGLNDDQVKAVAASVQVPGGLDDEGKPTERAGLPSDHFKAPYPNEKAARAANGGALPPDQSVIEKAREGGADYIHALLNGYEEAPPGVKVGEGLYYNKWFPGGQLAMPQPLRDGQVDYADKTKATVEQMSVDVTSFLTWSAQPEMEGRKQMGIKWVSIFVVLTGLTYAVKKKIWKDVH